jgi:mannose-6-phosphate isomerase-like protein (cupin superfamily)
MTSSPWDTQEIATAPMVTAPDGSEVRVLCATGRGSMIQFSLPPDGVSKAVAHRSVEEIWYVASGAGRLWRKLGDLEETVDLVPGLSLTIPAGTHFQFCCDGAAPLQIVAATMPPWPGSEEAYVVIPVWSPGD